jgi:hypothetical protein
MMKKSEKIRWNPIVARLAEISVKNTKVAPAPKKKKVPESRWNPIVAKLADDKLKQPNGMNVYKDNERMRIKVNWANTVQKKRTDEEFHAYLKGLFNSDGPKVKYQNPDSWIIHPTKKKTDETIDS